MQQLKNPLLPGFYPDPSVCRVGNDFYLVTSSFEFFPGVPVFHSTDFCHWRQIGHCLDRPSQLNLDSVKPSQGIYAATIRHHNGLFYMVTTLVQDPPYHGNVNFFVTAENPAGPWSDPIVVEGAPGIDPTLYFEDDRAYYLGNLRPEPDNPERTGRHIWLQELDLTTGKLIGERHILRTDGAVYGARAPEAPHLYRVGAYYYLLIAEGGTAHDHAVSVFRSRSLSGPYEMNPRNPIFTHRNLRRPAPINSVGHADLIELPNGEWWAVLLASRPVGGDFRNLGRETFALPVHWEEDWPVFSGETGRLEFSYPAPELPPNRFPSQPACDHFDSPELDLRWNYLRTPRRPLLSLTERPGFLRLLPGAESLCKLESPSFLGRRQQHLDFTARTVMEYSPGAGDSAGLVMLLNHDYHLRLERQMLEGVSSIVLTRRFAGEDKILASREYGGNRIWLMVEAHSRDYSFYFASTPEQWELLAGSVDGSLLSKETAGGFTGAYVGLYATSENGVGGSPADFDWFEYQPLE